MEAWEGWRVQWGRIGTWDGRGKNWDLQHCTCTCSLPYTCVFSTLSTDPTEIMCYFRRTCGAAARAACCSNSFTASFAACRFDAGSHVFSHSG